MAQAQLNFGAQVADWVRKVEGLEEDVFRNASRSLMQEVTEPGPSKASHARARKEDKTMGPIRSGGSGRLPVDTGFLWHSFQVSTAAMPVINAAARPADGVEYTFAIDGAVANINTAKLGGTIYMGFTAAYAAHVEFGANGHSGAGMVRLAAQNWPQHVASAVSKAAAAVGRV